MMSQIPKPPESDDHGNHVLLTKFIMNGNRTVYVNTCLPKYKKELFLTFPDQAPCVCCGKIVKYGTGIIDAEKMIESPIYMLTTNSNAGETGANIQWPFCGKDCMEKTRALFDSKQEFRALVSCFHCGKCPGEMRFLAMGNNTKNVAVVGLCNEENCIECFLDWTKQDAFGEKSLVCNICQTPAEKLFRCGRCKLAMYCSQKCQKADWKSHKPLCKSR
jgi:hypothetical protein